MSFFCRNHDQIYPCLKREQLSDVTRDQHSSGQHEIIRELQMTIKDRGRRIDALKVHFRTKIYFYHHFCYFDSFLIIVMF